MCVTIYSCIREEIRIPTFILFTWLKQSVQLNKYQIYMEVRYKVKKILVIITKPIKFITIT